MKMTQRAGVWLENDCRSSNFPLCAHDDVDQSSFNARRIGLFNTAMRAVASILNHQARVGKRENRAPVRYSIFAHGLKAGRREVLFTVVIR